MDEPDDDSPSKHLPKGFKIPKALGAVADKLYQVRQDYLAMSNQLKSLKAQETALREHLVQKLPKSLATGVAGKLARATANPKTVPVVKDWDKFYAHVKRTGDFDLMQRRLATKAVEARWENKKKVPGVEAFDTVTISLNKV